MQIRITNNTPHQIDAQACRHPDGTLEVILNDGLPNRLTPEADLEALADIVRGYRDPVVIEIGSWVGHSALRIMEAGAKKLYCIDTWTGGSDQNDRANQKYAKLDRDAIYHEFLKNVDPYLYYQLMPLRMDSLKAAKECPITADIIFIDADHTYESVKADIAAWMPHLRPGGTLCGHDYDPIWPGVVQAVDEAGLGCISGISIWRLSPLATHPV